MEGLIFSVFLAAICGMSGQILLAVLICRCLPMLYGQPRAADTRQDEPTETPEEQEARRVAAEAQRLYEQGFVNLMRYDGSPGRKEREVQ